MGIYYFLFKDPPWGFCNGFSLYDYSGALERKPFYAVVINVRLVSNYFS